ncbi:glutamate--cysteine ligase [Hydrogenophaga sp.]|uniref:glutamate--cysteine ligase n=1 Tax=Hydrogenophaga sp. TaxID=1904254 RepID=UPI002628B103|nr:glutamate--cysteine ligase [Hydrogenophaga sp.]MDM7949430.1 glutamate--cysteine ligase [Hydrogenophaga sp.]
MTTMEQRLAAVTTERLRGMRRGLEKESLRVQHDGKLALTPHPKSLGSALTHPHITTDFSESQLELITGVHDSVTACLDELAEVHQFTARCLHASDEMMWASSMPCGLPSDETIPIGLYGPSNVGRAKSVYRIGLGHRYGRRMQTISGIHYNWSLPGVDNDGYFSLIRNFRRHAFLLLTLFGASPAVCSSFVAGRQHELQPLGTTGSLYMPHGTSLRMGRLGYQSEAQASLKVSYNGLEGYAASLHDALSRPWPAYETIGVRNPGGDYNQLSTSLLQIENEFYGTIRPKRVIYPGERPLHALRERGVEYVEVRLLDLNPFESVGIDAATLRFIDVFLLHCLLTDSAPDTPAEIEALAHNQQQTAARGREPGVRLQRDGAEVLLIDWGLEIIDQLAPFARALDEAHGGGQHAEAVDQARARLLAPETLPSARVLQSMRTEHADSFIGFVRSCTAQNQDRLLQLPWSSKQQARYEAMALQSMEDQRKIEAADTMPFEIYRQEYTSPARLGRPKPEALAALV